MCTQCSFPRRWYENRESQRAEKFSWKIGSDGSPQGDLFKRKAGATQTFKREVKITPAGSSGKQPQAGATSRPASPTRKRLLQETCEASASNDHLLSPPRPHKAPPTPPQLLKATPLQPEGCGHQDPERKIEGRSHRSAFLCSWD